MLVPIESIIVGERCRKDKGDIGELAASIKALGQLQPIGIRPDNTLVCGERRLLALRRLGRVEVAAHICEGLSDEIAFLKAERDENTCREPLLTTESVALGRRLEASEREAAKQRQAATRARPGEKVGAKGGANLAAPKGGEGKATAKVAAAVGMKRTSYEKARAVVEAAEKEPEKFAPVVAEMDRTGKVDPAYKQVRRHEATNGRKTPSEVAKNDPSVKWAGFWVDLSRLLISIRAHGGMESLVAKWSKEQRNEYLARMRAALKEIQGWVAYLEGME